MTDPLAGSPAPAARFTRVIGRGYAPAEVDAFVEDSRVRTAALERDLGAARQEADALRAQLRLLSASPVGRAVDVLRQAQQTADAALADAHARRRGVEAEAAQRRAEAERWAAQWIQQARAEAQAIDRAAQDAAAERERTAAAQAAALVAAAQARAAELDAEIDRRRADFVSRTEVEDREVERQARELRALYDVIRAHLSASVDGALLHLAAAFGQADPLAGQEFAGPARAVRSAASAAPARPARPAAPRQASRQRANRNGSRGSGRVAGRPAAIPAQRTGAPAAAAR